MSYLSLNGADLKRATIVIPRNGAWTADLEHINDPTVAAGDAVSLIFGSQTFVGTVVRLQSNQAPGFDTRIVGGADGLSTLLDPAQFRSPTARNVIDAAMMAGGETLSATSDTAAMLAPLAFWERPQRTLGQELDAITAALALEWRVLLDGTVWIGSPAWTASSLESSDYEVLELNADRGLLFIAAEDPTVLPGQTLEGIRVGQVIHRIEPQSTRTEIYADHGMDRSIGVLDALIRRSAPRDLFAHYEYRVISQTGATLELRSLDSRMPDLSGVPYRPATPGEEYTVAAGARCLVGFVGGSEQAPYIAAWTAGTPVSVAFPVSSLLHLGAVTGADFVALSTLVNTRIAALEAAFNVLVATFTAHVHPGVTVGAGVTLITATPGVAVVPGASTAATRVRAT